MIPPDAVYSHDKSHTGSVGVWGSSPLGPDLASGTPVSGALAARTCSVTGQRGPIRAPPGNTRQQPPAAARRRLWSG